MITNFHFHSLQYVNEADLINYAWSRLGLEARHCAFCLIDLGNYRHLAFRSGFYQQKIGAGQ